MSQSTLCLGSIVPLAMFILKYIFAAYLQGGLPETGRAFDGQGQGREEDSSQPSKFNKQNRPPSSTGDDLPSVRDGKIGQDRPGLEKDPNKLNRQGLGLGLSLDKVPRIFVV